MNSATAIAQAQQRWLQEQGYSSFEEHRESQLPKGWDRTHRQRVRIIRNAKRNQRRREWFACPGRDWQHANNVRRQRLALAAMPRTYEDHWGDHRVHQYVSGGHVLYGEYGFTDT